MQKRKKINLIGDFYKLYYKLLYKSNLVIFLQNIYKKI